MKKIKANPELFCPSPEETTAAAKRLVKESIPSSDLFRKYFGDQSAVDMKHPNMENFFLDLNKVCLREDNRIQFNIKTPDQLPEYKGREISDWYFGIGVNWHNEESKVMAMYDFVFKKWRILGSGVKTLKEYYDEGNTESAENAES